MENNPITLEVGTVLYYCEAFSEVMRKIQITRTTAKRAYALKKGAFCDYEVEFDREQDSGDFIQARGSHGYGANLYQVETPELLEKYTRQHLARKLQAIKWESLPMATMQAVLAYVENGGKNDRP